MAFGAQRNFVDTYCEERLDEWTAASAPSARNSKHRERRRLLCAFRLSVTTVWVTSRRVRTCCFCSRSLVKLEWNSSPWLWRIGAAGKGNGKANQLCRREFRCRGSIRTVPAFHLARNCTIWPALPFIRELIYHLFDQFKANVVESVMIATHRGCENWMLTNFTEKCLMLYYRAFFV